MKKIAVITGASSGMGREVVIQISDRFEAIDEIWLIARRKERMEEYVNDIDTKCVILAGDLSDASFIQSYEELLANSHAGVKILVNAAGYGSMGDVSEISTEDNVGMIQLNCEALTAITRITLPYMLKKSRIINFASSAAFLPQPGFAVYAASKSYVLSFSRALNQELKSRQVFVTAVCPGPVATEFFGKAEQTHKRAWYKDMFMADCDEVVNKALDDSINRKQTSIYGLGMKGLYLITKIIPMHILMGIISVLNAKKD